MGLLIRNQIYRNLMVLGKNRFDKNDCLKKVKQNLNKQIKKDIPNFVWSLFIFAKKLQCFHLNFIKNLKIAWLR